MAADPCRQQLARLVIPGQHELPQPAPRHPHAWPQAHVGALHTHAHQQSFASPVHLFASPVLAGGTPPRFLTSAHDGPPSAQAYQYSIAGQGARAQLPLSFRQHHQPSSPSLFPQASFSPAAGINGRQQGLVNGPYLPLHFTPSLAHAPRQQVPFARLRIAGAGHRSTESVGPPPKAKLGGAGTGAGLLQQREVEPGALRQRKVIVKLPRAEGDDEPPLWLRSTLAEREAEEAAREDARLPEIISREPWPQDEEENVLPEVYLPSTRMWEKLKQDRFEAMMAAQGIDVRGDQVHLHAPSASILGFKGNSRSSGALGHRPSASLAFSRHHRSSLSVSPAAFAQAVHPSSTTLDPFSLLAPHAWTPELSVAAGTGGENEDGKRRPDIHAPIPRRQSTLHQHAHAAEALAQSGSRSSRSSSPESGNTEEFSDSSSKPAHNLQPSLSLDMPRDGALWVGAPVFIPGGGHARPQPYVGSVIVGGDAWDERQSQISDETFSNPSDEEMHQQQRALRSALHTAARIMPPTRRPGDIVLNPSGEEENESAAGEAHARLNALHAGPPLNLNLNPRAPAFVFGRQPVQSQTPIVHGPHAALGSPVKLTPAPAAFDTATSSVSQAPSSFTALEHTPPTFGRPSGLTFNGSTRPLNIAAPELQPRALPPPLTSSGPKLARSHLPSQFVPPPGLLTLRPSNASTAVPRVGRPLPTPPLMAQAILRHEGDDESGKRMRVNGPTEPAVDAPPSGHLPPPPPSSPRNLPVTPSRTPRDGPVNRMHAFKMPIGPVAPSPEHKLDQAGAARGPFETFENAHDDNGQASSRASDANEDVADLRPSQPSDLFRASWKQRSPIPKFDSPPPTLRPRASAAVLSQSSTPARPLPAIPISTPIHEASRSLAGSISTDDEPSLLPGLVATPAPSSGPSVLVSHPGQLDELVRRLQVVLDDKLTMLRLLGPKGGTVHLASLHPDAEQSLLDRLSVLLDVRDNDGGLGVSVDVVRSAVEEGCRVVCERIEGSLADAIRSLESLLRDGADDEQRQALFDNLDAQDERAALILEHLEDHADKLDRLVSAPTSTGLSTSALESMRLAVKQELADVRGQTVAELTSLVDGIHPALAELQHGLRVVDEQLSARLNAGFGGLESRPSPVDEIVSRISDLIGGLNFKTDLDAAQEKIAATVEAIPKAEVLDVDGLVQRLVNARSRAANADLAPLMKAIDLLHSDVGRTNIALKGSATRVQKDVKEELAAQAERLAAARVSEDLVAEQLRASEAERTRLSDEAAKLRRADLEHLALQTQASLAAQADKYAIEEARAKLKVTENERDAALERERVVSRENAEKSKEVSKLKIKVNVLVSELDVHTRENGKTQRVWASFQTSVQAQLDALTSTIQKGQAVEERNRELKNEITALSDKLAFAEEKLQSHQRASSAAAVASKQAQANLQQRFSETEKEAALRAREGERSTQAQQDALDATLLEQRSISTKLAETERVLAAAQAENERLQALIHPPETPRASQQRPLSASSWVSPHPLVQELQNQVHPLSPPQSTLRPRPAHTATTSAQYPPAQSPKGAMASMWAPQTLPQPSARWTPPVRTVTPVPRPSTVKPPETSDGWWSAL